jgi:hypothetical protein
MEVTTLAQGSEILPQLPAEHRSCAGVAGRRVVSNTGFQADGFVQPGDTEAAKPEDLAVALLRNDVPLGRNEFVMPVVARGLRNEFQ